jgi:hypothetical protein
VSSCQPRLSTTRLTVPTRDLLEWPSAFGSPRPCVFSQGGKSIEVDDTCRDRIRFQTGSADADTADALGLFQPCGLDVLEASVAVNLAGRSSAGSSRDFAALLPSFSPHGTARAAASWLHNASRAHDTEFSPVSNSRARGISTWMS